MIVLAIDTCDARGSVAVLLDSTVLHKVVHEGAEEYSSWLLPATNGALLAAGERSLSEVDLYAVSAGPGSFTGVRIGLTTVKAWAEVFGKPIVAVSRLEVLAKEGLAGGSAPTYVASFVTAQKDQLFGAAYRRAENELTLEGEELVAGPEEFLARVEELAGTDSVAWVSTDASPVIGIAAWTRRADRGEEIMTVSSTLAPLIGKLGHRRALAGKVTDALQLDANYVRRPYVEVNWKGAHAGPK